MKRTVALTLCLLAMAALDSVAGQRDANPPAHKLAATPKTVAWGYYDASTPPVLRIRWLCAR